MPAVLITVGVLLSVTTDQGLPGSPFFTVAPLVAAPFASTLVTALTGCVSAAALALVLLLVTTPREQDDLTTVVTVAAVGLLAVGINLLLRRTGAALASVRTIAESTQLAVLPAPPSRIGDLRIAARYEAAQSDARIGGDLYAVHETPRGVRLIVGDVRGKGMEAVRAVAVAVGTFREAADQEATLEAVARRLDHALLRERQRRTGADAYEDFTTAVIAEIPAGNSSSLRLLNRGHPPPLLLAGGRNEFLEPAEPALPLGMSELGQWPDHVDEITFPHGMQIFFYTDGLSEARNKAGAFFEPGTRLAGRVFRDPDALLDAVLADVAAYVGGEATDDLALVAVQRGDGAE